MYVVAGLVVLVSGLAAAVVGLAIQFYPAAIVVGDAGPIRRFGYSFELFEEHFASVLGNSVVVKLVWSVWLVVVYLAILLAFGGVGAVTSAASGTETASMGPLLAGLLLVVVAVRTIEIALLRTYHVAFVRSVTS